MTRYNNPENLSEEEIRFKVTNMGIGPNRNRRCSLLLSYNTDVISNNDWIKKYLS